MIIHLYIERAGRDEPFCDEQFSDVAKLRERVIKLQKHGLHFRLDFAATVALIKDGAYGASWDKLRREAVDAELERRHADGDYDSGLSSSDANHITVGYVYGWHVFPESDYEAEQRETEMLLAGGLA